MPRAADWKSGGFPGIRYREHSERKHGRQPDRYYAIRYRFNKKNFEEAVGWASEGVKLSAAFRLLSDLKQNQRMGTPPFTLAEKRAMEEAQRQAEAETEAQQQRDRITVKEFFEGDYLKAQVEGGKKPDSIGREKELFKLFIGPQIGKKAFHEVSPFDVERIKAKMARTDRAQRTIQYCLAVIRQIFNTARFMGLHALESPTAKVKKPRFDNKRVRHLTEAEAAALLAKIKEKSLTAYQQTVLSLYAGLRFGEIVSLTRGDVDLDRGILTLRDTKSGRTRAAFITEKIRTEVFGKLEPGRPDDPVFPSRSKKRGEYLRISPAFREAVIDLGLNDGISAPRMKVCFHTCRHTFASWLVERGTDLFQVSKLLGHSTIALTERYSPSSPKFSLPGRFSV
jgi:integrase